MDLALYARVLWRFRTLVVTGLVLALGLTILSVARVDLSHGLKLGYREPQQWMAESRLFVTQQGFPWGRSVVPSTSGVDSTGTFADPTRFTELAIIYAQLATSDVVEKRIRKQGPLGGEIIAGPVQAPNNGGPLPLVEIDAVANSKPKAVQLARRATEALQGYIRGQQISSKTPPSERVYLEVVKQPTRPELFSGRSFTRPIVVFLAVMFAVIALAFVLENTRPRIHALPNERTGVENVAAGGRKLTA